MRHSVSDTHHNFRAFAQQIHQPLNAMLDHLRFYSKLLCQYNRNINLSTLRGQNLNNFTCSSGKYKHFTCPFAKYLVHNLNTCGSIK